MTVVSRNRTSRSLATLSPSRTWVCVLVRETAGRVPVICKTFSHVEPAEAFIQGRLATGARQGFLVFWTLPGEPPADRVGGDQPAEVIVLIPEKRADSVLYFAFPDVKTARGFVQREFPGRDASITWAFPIRVSTDERGDVNLSPSTPPQMSTAKLCATVQTDVQEALAFADQATQCDREEVPPTPLTVEVRKVLAMKRWVFSQGSFAGFRSPPGRF